VITGSEAAATVRRMAEPFARELLDLTRVVGAHCEEARKRGLSFDQSTSMEDCLLLYTLVRHFRRTRAFEVGTNIGTTAVAINEAARANGGVFTTCDPVDYGALSPWSGIRFIRASSEIALALLEAEGHTIDFAFFDWIPSEAAVAVLDRICTADTVLATHDYETNSKGAEVIGQLARGYRRSANGRWFAPGPVTLADGTRVNVCTAFFLPAA
jgi:hypothetical protein